MRTSRNICRAAAVVACVAVLPLAAAPIASAEDAYSGKQGAFRCTRSTAT